jgi:serine/threonine protein kinase
MDHVTGRTLSRMVRRLRERRGRRDLERAVVPERSAIQVAAAVARGLRAAHARGVVHGNLKPRNVLITRAGGVLVTDASFPRTSEFIVVTSGAGLAEGTFRSQDLAFTAPELVEHRDLQPSSDVYSLGVLLCYMLSGRMPFTGKPEQIMGALSMGESPLGVILGLALQDRTVEVLKAMTGRAPSWRYEDMNELLDALAGAASALDAGGGPASSQVTVQPVKVRRPSDDALEPAKEDSSSTLAGVAGAEESSRIVWGGRHASKGSPVMAGENISGVWMEDLTGTSLGGAVLQRLLARTLTGDVYISRDEETGKRRVTKVFVREAIPTEAAVQRFVSRGRLAMKLRHPNLCQCYAAGNEPIPPVPPGLCYTVFEHSHGLPLSMVVKRNGMLPERLALGVVLLAARGLLAAHGHGIIHGDLKPSKLMVNRKGIVKVTQTGVVRTSEIVADEAKARRLPHAVSGDDVCYVCPEIAVGAGGLGPPADVYALGLMLYLLLTGRPPRSGSVHEVLKDIESGRKPRWVPVDPATAGTRELVNHMVERKPEDRIRTMDELISRIGRRLAELGG